MLTLKKHPETTPLPLQPVEIIAENKPENIAEKPVLVLIEDNIDIVAYVTTLLSPYYQIHTAYNGQAGIEKVLEVVPDIVISDVRMPEKDGYEVCEILKNDERSSHIPIILLTAKSALEDRLTGLRGGADAYLTKPFEKEELFIRLEKLVEIRQVLKARFSNPKWMYSQEKSSEPSLEEKFLLRLADAVKANLDNPEFGVKDLCEVANLSNMQVNRKLKALTDKTPSRFIRSVRLQEAIRLLQVEKLNVSEAAYAVGFSDPNYFSRSFSEEFGYPPSELRV